MATPSSPAAASAAPLPAFTPYQKSVVGMLAFLQFAVILDFMLMSPLGAVIMPALAIDTRQFGLVVSGYAFSAGISGLLTAGFADRFDRKRLLLFFYTGFVLGTLWCGLATSFESLLAARIVTGLFGGVIGSVVMAIATDLFPPQQRGRVMGMIQSAFAASQVLGIPAGIWFSNHWHWQAPFLAMALLGLAGGLVVAWRMQPVDGHLKLPQEHSPWMHLFHTAKEPRHLIAFACIAVLTTGGFMMMPFSSAFAVNNLGIPLQSLPTVYLVTGLCTIFVGPMIGRLSDRIGKFKVFVGGSLLSATMTVIYTHLPPIGVATLVVVNAVLFVGIFSRMIPYQAIASTVPPPQQRGAFNAFSASLQQLAGGVASVVAGHVVAIGADGRLMHFEVVGYVMVGTSALSLWLVWRLIRSGAAKA